MNTRSRQRKKNLEDSDIQTLNGSITSSPPDSPTSNSASPESSTTRHINGNKNKLKSQSTQSTTPVKTRRGIVRVPIATWNFFVRKWEIPRKTLHVSIGKNPL